MMGKESNDKVENHNKGQKDGSRGNLVTDAIRITSQLITGRTEYDKGYPNGRKNPSKK